MTEIVVGCGVKVTKNRYSDLKAVIQQATVVEKYVTKHININYGGTIMTLDEANRIIHVYETIPSMRERLDELSDKEAVELCVCLTAMVKKV